MRRYSCWACRPAISSRKHQRCQQNAPRPTWLRCVFLLLDQGLRPYRTNSGSNYMIRRIGLAVWVVCFLVATVHVLYRIGFVSSIAFVLIAIFSLLVYYVIDVYFRVLSFIVFALTLFSLFYLHMLARFGRIFSSDSGIIDFSTGGSQIIDRGSITEFGYYFLFRPIIVPSLIYCFGVGVKAWLDAIQERRWRQEWLDRQPRVGDR